ncbi:MAG TPA: hypothetical protein VGI85_15565 [Chthoniobacterales bacterium]|jgi:Spy/CpxP family protein refolding chaperone
MSASLKWKLAAGFVVVFIAGLAAGAYLGAVQSHHHHFDFGHRYLLTRRLQNRMEKHLGLTPAQISKTAPIFEKTARQLEAIRTQTGQRVHEVFAEADRELAPDLTPEQRAKLLEMEAKHRREHDRP